MEKGIKIYRQDSAVILAPFEISNHPAGDVVLRGTGDTAAGMGTGTAKVKVINGGSILGRLGVRAQAEQLVQVVVSIENNFPVCKVPCTATDKPDFNKLVSNIKSLQTP